MELPPSGGLGAPGGEPKTPGYYAPPAGTGTRPAVILWYRVYALVALLLYAGLGFAIGAFRPDGHQAIGLGLAAAIPIAVIFGLGAAVPFKPWGWTYGLVVIAFGMLSCFAPLSVILIIFWSRPEVRAAFGRL